MTIQGNLTAPEANFDQDIARFVGFVDRMNPRELRFLATWCIHEIKDRPLADRLSLVLLRLADTREAGRSPA